MGDYTDDEDQETAPDDESAEGDDGLSPEQRALRDRLIAESTNDITAAVNPDYGPQVGEITMGAPPAQPQAPLRGADSGSVPFTGDVQVQPDHAAMIAADQGGGDRRMRATQALTALAQETAGGLSTPTPEAERATHDALRVPEAVRPRGLKANTETDDRLQNARLIDALTRGLGGIGLGIAESMAGPRGLPDRQAILSQLASMSGPLSAESAVRGDMQRETDLQTSNDERVRQQQADAAAQAEQARIGRLRDPSSPESQRTQGQIAALAPDLASAAGQFSAEEGQRIVPSLVNSREQRATAEGSAAARAAEGEANRQAQMERLQAQIAARAQDWSRRHPGGGAGHGAQNAAAREELYTIAEQAGIPRAVASQVPPSRLAAQLAGGMVSERTQAARVSAQRAARFAAPASGIELLPGVHATIGMTDTEAARMREGFDVGRTAVATMGRIQQLSDQYGPTAVISPEAAARVRADLIPLRSFVAQMQGTGIINPTEVPVINAALNDPTSLSTQTFGTLRAGVDEWRQLSERGVRARLANRGVSEAEQDVAVQELFGGLGVAAARGRSRATQPARAAAPAAPGAPQAPTPAPAGTTTFRSPTGRLWHLTAEQAAEAARRGVRLEEVGGGS